MKRYDYLDALRGIAALIVVIYHCFACSGSYQRLPFGGLAVDFFFFLSGFVVCHAYQTRLMTTMSFSDFCKARFLRLYPMIILGITIGTTVMLFRIFNEYHHEWLKGLILSIPTNLLLLPSPFLTMGWKSAWPLNGPHWSLTFEIVANLLFAKYFFKLSSKQLFITTILMGLALLASINQYGFDVGFLLDQIHLGFIRVMFPFFAGVLIYRLTYDQSKINTHSTIAYFWITSLLLVCSLCAPYSGEYKNYFAIIFIFIISPVIIFLGSRVHVSEGLLPCAKWLGFISYPLYAIHMPILKIVQSLNFKYHFDNYQLIALFSVAFIFSVFISYVLAINIEPIIKKYLNNLSLLRK